MHVCIGALPAALLIYDWVRILGEEPFGGAQTYAKRTGAFACFFGCVAACQHLCVRFQKL